jgi:aldose 1-epimerase
MQHTSQHSPEPAPAPRRGGISRRRLLSGAALGGAAAALSGGLSTVALAASPTPAPSGTGADADESAPSGRQLEIAAGALRAVITEEGAGLRSFTVGGTEFLNTFPAGGWASDPSYGQLLLPWPNRVAGGRYTDPAGAQQQLPVNEVKLGNAIHGLTRWMNWVSRQDARDRVTLSLVLHASPGYPWVLQLTQEYRLTTTGLRVTTAARNLSTAPAPVGAGSHPYLTVGTPTIDAATLTIPAKSYFQTDDHNIPTGNPGPVDGTPFDFRSARSIGTTQMDTGFADLIRGSDGLARVVLAAPGGRPAVTVWLDQTHQYLQIYTGDTLPDENARRRGIAIEPYTCASDAFNNRLGLEVLKPGETFSSSWGITAVR